VAWQLAEKARRKKVDPLRRGYVDHDVLKALLDLRAVWAVPRSSLARYFDEGLRAELVELLPQAAERTDIYWQSHHYALVKGKYSSPREELKEFRLFETYLISEFAFPPVLYISFF
jgi:hypothetical protein